MFMNKRAVSPLIATVLLVMIVVSIGAAVMVVIQGLSEENLAVIDQNKELIACSTEVDVEILSYGTTNRICYNGTGSTGTFALTVKNTGSKEIADWRFTAISDTISEVDGGKTAVPKQNYSSIKFDFSYSGSIVKFLLSPKISGGASNPTVTCSLGKLEWDDTEITEMTNCSASGVTWDDTISP